MRRAICTISKAEYNRLLAEAASRMRKKLIAMIEQECSLMRQADNSEDYSKAETHDFNQRALCMAIDALYLTGKEDKK